MKGILKWLGFPHVRIIDWRKQVINKRRPADKSHTVGRLLVATARSENILQKIKDAVPVDSVEINWDNRGGK